MHRLRLQHVAPGVQRPNDGGVGIEQLDRRARDRAQRLGQRHALGEGLRDLVEGAQLPRRLALGLQRASALGAEALSLLVQAGVLDGDAELRGEGGEQGDLVAARHAATRQVGDEQPDRVVEDDERHGDRGLHIREGNSLADALEPRVAGRVLDHEGAAGAQRPERPLEQRRADVGMRPVHAAGGRGTQPAVLPQVDGHALGAEQLGHAGDRRLECVRDRELGDRLADDTEERARPLELRARPLAAPAGVERAARSTREGLERAQRPGGSRLVEQELQQHSGRIVDAQRDGGRRLAREDDAAVARGRTLRRRERRGGIPRQPERRERLRRGAVVAELPQHRGPCARAARGEPDDGRFHARALSPGCERLTGGVQEAGFQAARLARISARDQRRLRRGDPREDAVGLGERGALAEQLNGADAVVAGGDRHDEGRVNARALRGPA